MEEQPPVTILSDRRGEAVIIEPDEGGVTNIILDYARISLFDLGIQGAAIATGLGYSITAVAGFLVFRKKKNLFYFEKPVFRRGVLFHASANGMSELATSLVSGITTLLFNLAMLKYIGEDGVAAITIIMYVLMFVCALFIGYSCGVVSAVLAFSRSFLFTVASIQIMPVLLGGVTGGGTVGNSNGGGAAEIPEAVWILRENIS